MNEEAASYVTKIVIDTWKPLADHLTDLQLRANPGQGVGCVQTLVMYLRKGEVGAARVVAYNESDKLWAYPEIRKLIHCQLAAIGYQDENGKFIK